MNHSQIVSFIWGVADLIRDTFKRGKYQDVILPLTVLRRLDCAGFSPNMREVLEKFDFDNTIAKLDESGLLFQVVQRFADPRGNLHPEAVDNFTMGTIFEELIRKFNEALNESPGEHFTPRDVVHLMVAVLIAGDEKRLRTKGIVRSVYDPPPQRIPYRPDLRSSDRQDRRP